MGLGFRLGWVGARARSTLLGLVISGDLVISIDLAEQLSVRTWLG